MTTHPGGPPESKKVRSAPRIPRARVAARSAHGCWPPSSNHPTTPSSARHWTESSRPGTRRPSGFTATRQARSSASLFRSWRRGTASMRRRRSSKGSATASGSTITRRRGARRMARPSRSRSPSHPFTIRPATSSAHQRSPATSPNGSAFRIRLTPRRSPRRIGLTPWRSPRGIRLTPRSGTRGA